MDKKLSELITTYNWLNKAWDAKNPLTKPMPTKLNRDQLDEFEDELFSQFKGQNNLINDILYALLQKCTHDMKPYVKSHRSSKGCFL